MCQLASSLVINKHCDPMSNIMLVSASTQLDNAVAMAVFISHIPSTAATWFEDKVVRVIVVLVGGPFEVVTGPGVVVDEFFGSVGVSMPVHKLVWHLQLQCLQ